VTCRAAVVIPLYQCAAGLPHAVRSVLASAASAVDAGFPLFLDLVVVDDASRDDGAAVAEALLRPNVLPPGIVGLLLRHDENRGAGPARDTGVAATDADLIFFLDADDEFLPAHIPLCLAAMHDDPGLGYVWTRRVWEIPIHESWSTQLDRSTVMNLCIRRDRHVRIGGFPRHPDFRDHGYEDSFYRRLLFQCVRGQYIDEPTILFHLRPGGTQAMMAAKICRPYAESRDAPDDRTPTAAMLAEFQARLPLTRALRAELGLDP